MYQIKKYIFSLCSNAKALFFVLANKGGLKTAMFMSVFFATGSQAQVRWQNVDAAFGPLPTGFHVFKTTDSLNGKPFLAYYAVANLKNKKLLFSTDTTYKRRLTPTEFYRKNGYPLLLVNCSFFSFTTHQNLNTVITDGKLVGYNQHVLPLGGKDTFQYRHPVGSALGITRRRNADIAWLFTNSAKKYPFASQRPSAAIKDSNANYGLQQAQHQHGKMTKWKMQTAVGGGPVLVQDGEIKITNNEELKFGGKAINDQHPRTVIGYTKTSQLVILVIQGRTPGISEGATLLQEAQLMKDLGCVEALNLDGGGSSCMLINGKETITPSSKGEQRAIPAVFMILAR